MCKNRLSVKTVVYNLFVRKGTCAKKFLMCKNCPGYIKFLRARKSVCKNFCVQSVCTSFSVSNVFLCRKNMCKNCSVQRFLCGKGSVCKNAYVPLFMRAKASKQLCVDTSFFA